MANPTNIVVACETENAEALVGNINDTLTEKLCDYVDARKKELGYSLLGEDYVAPDDRVEEETDEEDVSEDTSVDSTKETGSKKLSNHDSMDDEDVSKRVRYEATAADVLNAIVEMRTVAFDNGDKIEHLSENQANAIKTVFDGLNENNKNTMIETLTESRCGFVKMVSWCVQQVDK